MGTSGVVEELGAGGWSIVRSCTPEETAEGHLERAREREPWERLERTRETEPDQLGNV